MMRVRDLLFLSKWRLVRCLCMIPICQIIGALIAGEQVERAVLMIGFNWALFSLVLLICQVHISDDTFSK